MFLQNGLLTDRGVAGVQFLFHLNPVFTCFSHSTCNFGLLNSLRSVSGCERHRARNHIVHTH